MTGEDAEFVQAITTEKVEECPLCQGKGELYYSDLTDRLYHTKGKWSFYRCNVCGVLWIDPRPVASEIHRLYQEYFTHKSDGNGINLIGYKQKGMTDAFKNALLPGRNSDIVAMKNMLLEEITPGKLLDIGCGDGSFLAHMRNLGWDVCGVEPDIKAAQVARDKYQLTVYPETQKLLDIAPMSFDAISLIHVIEHVPNPDGLLSQCRALLKSHGLLAIATPNIHSFGHLWFKHSWFPLEPPRHFILFNRTTLENLLENNGYKIRKSATFSRTASGIYHLSSDINRFGAASKSTRLTWDKKFSRTLFVFLEYWSNLIFGDFGEEIGILVEKT